jgi:hypothetical protein
MRKFLKPDSDVGQNLPGGPVDAPVKATPSK